MECGQVIWEKDLSTGKMFAKTLRCHNWKVCDFCFEEHVKEWQEKLDYLLGLTKGRIYIKVYATSKERDLAIRRIARRKGKYLSFSPEDELRLLHTDHLEGGVKALADEIPDMHLLARTRAGYRISDNLHLPKPDKKEGERVKIEVIKTSAPLKVEKTMWQKAHDLAGNPRPKTLQEAVEIAGLINLIFKALVEAEGYVVKLSLFLTQVVKRAIVAWSSDVIGRFGSEKPKSWSFST